jgi:methionine-rich copper-binding protein CopC
MSTLHQRVKLLIATLLSLGLMLVMVGMASAHTSYPAHAKVYKAIPAIGSTVSQAPTTVTVFTLENINPNPSKSNLFVYSPAGDLISQGNAKVSLTNPREMSITIKPDPANLKGVYVVRWITVSAEDGDPDQGAFVFTVNTGVVATPTTAATNQGTTTTTSTTNSSGGAPIWVPIVVGVLALLIGLGGGLGLGRRSSPASSVASMRKTIAQQQQQEKETTKLP